MKKDARVAGLLYLVTVVTGIFYLGYVPSQLAAHGDATATVARLVQSETLFRLGILAELACTVAFCASTGGAACTRGCRPASSSSTSTPWTRAEPRQTRRPGSGPPFCVRPQTVMSSSSPSI